MKPLEAFTSLMFHSNYMNDNNPNEREKEITIIGRSLKALEIICKYIYLDYETQEFVIHIPNEKQQEFDLLKEIILDKSNE